MLEVKDHRPWREWNHHPITLVISWLDQRKHAGSKQLNYLLATAKKPLLIHNFFENLFPQRLCPKQNNFLRMVQLNQYKEYLDLQRKDSKYLRRKVALVHLKKIMNWFFSSLLFLFFSHAVGLNNARPFFCKHLILVLFNFISATLFMLCFCCFCFTLYFKVIQ